MKRFPLHAIIILSFLFLPACTRSVNLSGLLSGTATPTLASRIQLPTPKATRPAGQAQTAGPGGSVWVSNPIDRAVLRIDLASNTIGATIPVDGAPEITRTGEGSVWALDKQHHQLFRIDPQAGRLIATIPLTFGSANDLAVGDGSVWVGMTGNIDLNTQSPGGEEEMLPPGLVVQIDPQSNAVVNKYSVQPVSRLAVSGTALWVLSRAIIDTPLQVIDLNSKQGMAVPIRNAPEWLPAEALAVDPANLWLFSAAYGEIFHAGPDGKVQSAVQLESQQPTGYADLLLAEGSLWAATPWGTVLRIDPKSNHVQGKVDLGAPLTQLIDGSGAVWALSQQTATLYRLDPTSAQVIAQIPLGSRVEPTVVPSPTPRVVLWKPCPDGPTSRLHVGDLAYVTKDPPLPNRVRKEPKVDADMLGYITPGGSMEILEGPACSNGWVWWKVKNADLEGWTAEGDPETYWLVPLFQ